MVHSTNAAFRGSKILLGTIILAAAEQLLGQAFVMPPAFPGTTFPIRGPGHAGYPMDGGYSMQSARARQKLADQHEEIQQFQEEKFKNMDRKSRRSNKIYDSYRKFQPNKFPENSPQWNMAMIQYLLDMKKNGHKIKEIETTKSLPEIHKSLSEGGPRLIYSDPDTEEESGLKIVPQEVEDPDPSSDDSKQGPIICKMEPFNVCYRVDSKGVMHPLGDRRPVRLLRVYKKK